MSAAAPIGVLGAGAWGTALAAVLASEGRQVLLWAREEAVVAEINRAHRNEAFLPDVVLPASVAATVTIADLAPLPVVLAVTPAQFLATTLSALGDGRRDLVLCAKGIEAGSGRLMLDVAREAMPAAAFAVLSGPTFAREVAMGLPTAVTLACTGGRAQWQRLSPVIARRNLRPYYSQDAIGAEIGGAVKNVLAIACGVVAGLGLGENARAALIARGFAEMTRFGAALGGQAETLAGLSGLGDLVLTCASPASRNYSLGLALGQGMRAEQALAGKLSVAEGAHTAPVLVAIAAKRGISMPIAGAVARLLAGEAPAAAVVADLLARPLTAESDAARRHETLAGKVRR
ncbi:MAG: NAD(P)-dependent glycerol-3-phosphate dehydrogenase [Sphingomonadales bacterium]|nr:NAD(P)-dependent glycerol-3-phosphate dehydrogenase [Sphingomonadales bacterium]